MPARAGPPDGRGGTWRSRYRSRTRTGAHRRALFRTRPLQGRRWQAVRSHGWASRARTGRAEGTRSAPLSQLPERDVPYEAVLPRKPGSRPELERERLHFRDAMVLLVVEGREGDPIANRDSCRPLGGSPLKTIFRATRDFERHVRQD